MQTPQALAQDGGRTEKNRTLPPSSNFKDVDYFRKRAEEARSLAEEMQDTHTKLLMLGIADSYEQIANWENRPREPNS